jgi:transposase
MYSHTGRLSVPPQVLLKSLLLQILFSIGSTRLLVEQFGYNILYHWLLGLSLEEKIWDHSTFSQSQERLIGTYIISRATEARLLLNDHFSVDGTLIEIRASIKSFRPRDGSGYVACRSLSRRIQKYKLWLLMWVELFFLKMLY